MEQRDAYRFATLRQTATGHTVTVLDIVDNIVHADNWCTGKKENQSLEVFLKEHEPMHAPTGLPRYAIVYVEPLPGFIAAARVSLIESEPAFCDECEPLVLQAKAGSSAVLADYLDGLTTGESWLCREADGLAEMDTQALKLAPTQEVSLSQATTSSRYPSQWFSLLIGAISPAEDDTEADTSLIELCLRDEGLAQQLFSAVVAGTVSVQR